MGDPPSRGGTARGVPSRFRPWDDSGTLVPLIDISCTNYRQTPPKQRQATPRDAAATPPPTPAPKTAQSGRSGPQTRPLRRRFPRSPPVHRPGGGLHPADEGAAPTEDDRRRDAGRRAAAGPPATIATKGAGGVARRRRPWRGAATDASRGPGGRGAGASAAGRSANERTPPAPAGQTTFSDGTATAAAQRARPRQRRPHGPQERGPAPREPSRDHPATPRGEDAATLDCDRTINQELGGGFQPRDARRPRPEGREIGERRQRAPRPRAGRRPPPTLEVSNVSQPGEGDAGGDKR